jgi:hypothetical protein
LLHEGQARKEGETKRQGVSAKASARTEGLAAVSSAAVTVPVERSANRAAQSEGDAE